jgi:hypothetical protein
MEKVFAHWAKMDSWSLEEATALSLGRDPASYGPIGEPKASQAEPDDEHIRRRDLIHRAIETGNLGKMTPPAEFVFWAIKRSLDLPAGLLSSVQRFSKKYVPPDPSVERVYISIRKSEYETAKSRAEFQSIISANREISALVRRVKDLESDVAKRDAEISRLENILDEKSNTKVNLLERERRTVLKLIITMAAAGYKYDYKSSRTQAASEIAGDAHRLGLSIDEDTVRKWLKEAAELLASGAKN